MIDELPTKIERWTARRRMALVLAILNHDLDLESASRKYQLKPTDIAEWVELFRAGAENALRSRPRDEGSIMEQQIRTMKQKIGEMVLEMDLLRSQPRGNSALAQGD